MNHDLFAEYQNIRLCPLRRETTELLRSWRNDPALNRFLRPIGFLTEEMQASWFSSYITDPNQIFFEILEIVRLHRVVGSVAIYNFDGDTAEIGRIVVGDPAAHGMKAGYTGMLLAGWVGFQQLGVRRYLLDVHEQNMPARIIYQQLGFKTIGKHKFSKGGTELEMELTKNAFEANHGNLQAIRFYRGEKDLEL